MAASDRGGNRPTWGHPRLTQALRRLALTIGLAGGVALHGCGGGGGSAGGLLQGVTVPIGGANAAVNPGAVVNADSIALISAQPSAVQILGAGGNTTATVTVEVRNQLGQPLDGECVSFSLANGGLGGGETINPTLQPATGCTAPTVGGRMSTTFRGGTIAGTVNLVAFIDTDGDGLPGAGEIATSVSLSVNGGPPFGNHFALAIERPNEVALNGPASFSILGLVNPTTAFLSDRFTNAVPDNTVVTFRTFDPVALSPAGYVDGSGSTAGGNSSVVVDTRTQVPAPVDGLMTAIGFAQGGTDAAILSLIEIGVAGAGTLFAGTDGGGIFRSTNRGASWTLVGDPDRGLFDGYVRKLMVDPADPTRIFAATNNGLYSSLTGLNWVRSDGSVRIYSEIPTAVAPALPCPGPTSCSFTLARSPLSVSRTFVYRAGSQTYQYRLAGTTITFTDGNGDPTPVPAGTQVTVDYDNFNRLPNGTIMDLVSAPLPGPSGMGSIFAGLLGFGVYRSDNGGNDWLPLNAGLSNLAVQALAFDPVSGALYAGTEGSGVFRNDTPQVAGSTWTQVIGAVPNRLLDLNVTTLSAGTVDAGLGRALVIAGTKAGGVHRSIDGGVNWTLPTGNPFVTAGDVDVAKVLVASATRVLALTLDVEDPSVTVGNLWFSGDGGVTFAPLTGTGLTTRFNFDVLNPLAGTEILVGGRGRAFYRSTDTGATFAPASGATPNRLTNGIYAGVNFIYSGITTLDTYVDLQSSNNGVGTPCNTAPLTCFQATVPNGGLRVIRFLVKDNANGRPLTAGTQITIGLVVDPPDETGAVLAGGGVANINSFNIFSGGGITDFFVAVRNLGVAGATRATVTCDVTSPNGNASSSLDFQLTP